MPAGVPILPPMRQSCSSQQRCHSGQLHQVFLSCLYGSQRPRRGDRPALSFLSCLCGSQPTLRALTGLQHFLSCLYGSQRRQSNKEYSRSLSKLPMRQSTSAATAMMVHLVSKLPIRQSTASVTVMRLSSFSKLPMRQSTNESE